MTASGWIARRARYAAAALRTRASSLKSAPWSQVWYVVEPRDWSVRWDGHYITGAVASHGISASTTLIPAGVRKQVVHYGSRNLFLLSRRLRPHWSNESVFTWFHGSEEDRSPGNRLMIDILPFAAARASRIITSSRIGARRLMKWGVPEAKIEVIPLGVDTALFRPVEAQKRRALREALGIPADVTCIGSFQKDGEGWGEGTRPKMIKGPDVFVEAMAALARRRAVHVLLTGPARGYVKDGLAKAGVPYTHINVGKYREVAPYYGVLDMYMVASRDEGGPKAVLEAPASGVPVVSTRVGMAADIIENGQNGLLTDIEDVDALVNSAEWLIDQPDVMARISANGRLMAERYDWSEVGRMYADRVYRPLLAGGDAEHSGDWPREGSRRAA